MSSGHPRITWRRNIAENFNRLSRVHERYRQTDDRQTDGRRHIANVNMSSRSLKTNEQVLRENFTTDVSTDNDEEPIELRKLSASVSGSKNFLKTYFSITPRVGPGHPLSPLFLHFPVFCSFLLFFSLALTIFFFCPSLSFLPE